MSSSPAERPCPSFNAACCSRCQLGEKLGKYPSGAFCPVVLTTVFPAGKSGIKTYLLTTAGSGKIRPFWTNNYREVLTNEHRPIYGANTAVLSDFPELVKATLHLIEKDPSDKAALIPLQCTASAAHPDYLFSLAMLNALPIEYREVALELIEHSLTSGFTVDEQSALLRFVEPLMATVLHAPRAR